MRDTIGMAREAGIIDFRDAFSEEHVQAVLQDLKAFEALVRADEREACAKVCDDLHPGLATKRAAELIRARGNT
jgi:ABC-type transporter MlaC component